MTLRSRFVALALLACAAGSARADAVFETRITIPLPVVLPRLVVVQPGVQVVEDLDEEVFFTDGWYWCRRGDHWYRARNPRATWVYADSRFIPPGLRQIPPGQYRRFRHAEWKQRQEEERERRHAMREEEKERRRAAKRWHREWKEERREERREERHDERREERHHDRDHDHDRGE